MNLKFVKFLLGGEHQELRVRSHPKRVRPADTSFLFAIRATNSFITKNCAPPLLFACEQVWKFVGELIWLPR